MIIDLGTFAVPAAGTAAPSIPSLSFGSDVVGYLKIAMSGPAYTNNEFFGGVVIPSVNVLQGGSFLAAVGVSGYDESRQNFGPSVGTFYITIYPTDALTFNFNQSASAYSADLEFHVVGSADITLHP